MKIKITDIHPGDAKYYRKDKIIGKIGELAYVNNSLFGDMFMAGRVNDIDGDGYDYFAGFKYIEVPEVTRDYSIKLPGGTMHQDGTVCKEPSSMSELGKWIDENKPFSHAYTPQRKTWIQKIRGYDKDVDLLNRQVDAFSKLAGENKKAYEMACEKNNDLCARIQAVESMRDHYKTIMTEALRDRDLHALVADVWQQRLICVQKDYVDATEMIGKRLKFSVGNDIITIIVGNPVTACYFETPSSVGDWNEEFLAVSICHKNDQFDWKRGAVESLENMIKKWIGNAYCEPSQYYNALFTAYPEIGIQPVIKPIKKTKKAKK
jgi:hypothetical protein